MCGAKQVLVRRRVQFSVWFWVEEAYLSGCDGSLVFSFNHIFGSVYI